MTGRAMLLLLALLRTWWPAALGAQQPAPPAMLANPEALCAALQGAEELRVVGYLTHDPAPTLSGAVELLALPCTIRGPGALRQLEAFLRDAHLEPDAAAMARAARGEKLATRVSAGLILDGRVQFAVLGGDYALFAGGQAYSSATYRNREGTCFVRELTLLLARLSTAGAAAPTSPPEP